MQKLRPRVLRQAVFQDRFDFFPAMTDLLDRTVRLEITDRRIEKDQLAGSRDVVMPNDDRVESIRVSRRRLGIEHAVRPVRVAPIVADLIRSVGIHREEKPVKCVRNVRVFPAQKHDPAVRHDRRVPVVLLVESQLADAAVRMANVSIRHVRRPAHTRNADHRSRRRKDEPSVRQIARVVIIDVGVLDRADLPRFRGLLSRQDLRRQRDLEQLPAAVSALIRHIRLGEHQTVCAEMQIQLADILIALRTIDRLDVFRFRESLRRKRDRDDVVSVPGVPKAGIALPVSGQSQFPGRTADRENGTDVFQRRVFQKCFAFQSIQPVKNDLRRSFRLRMFPA